MKRLALILFINITLANFIFCQHLIYDGIESYNDYLQNPAMISSERNCQIDLIGNSEMTKFNGHPIELLINSNITIPSIGSAFRLSYNYESFGPTKRKGFVFGLAHKHNYSEKFTMMLGGAFSLDNYKINAAILIPGDFPEDISVETNNYSGEIYNADFGIGMKYKKLDIGLSTKFSLFNEKTFILNVNRNRFNHEKTIFSSKYNFRIAKRFNVVPQFYVDIYSDRQNKLTTQPFFGIHLDYQDKVGIGIIKYQERLSFIGSTKLFKRLRLFLVLYDNNEYIYNNDGWNLMGQIRINI